ncbi:MAG: winged helix-turn-helix transcriptional regulator, partial [Thermoplasmata archaeon]|nr:winged helix-turn-helix transcriptional regulator [Thermoplasmata archaeon]
SGVNIDENYVWGNLTHFSIYALMSENVMDVPTPFVFPPFFLLIIGLFLGIMLFSAGSRSEPLVFMLAAGLLPAGADKENNEIRGEIKGMIMARPGVHYRWIKIQSGRANGTVAYHLKNLEDDGEIFSKRDGMFKRFYPKGVKKLKDIDLTPSKDIERSILEIVKEHPGASISEISYLIDEQRQKVHYHIRKMEQGGQIKISKDESGNTECYINT